MTALTLRLWREYKNATTRTAKRTDAVLTFCCVSLVSQVPEISREICQQTVHTWSGGGRTLIGVITGLTYIAVVFACEVDRWTLVVHIDRSCPPVHPYSKIAIFGLPHSTYSMSILLRRHMTSVISRTPYLALAC